MPFYSLCCLFFSPPSRSTVINEIIGEADFFTKERGETNEKRGEKREEWGSRSFLQFVDKRRLLVR